MMETVYIVRARCGEYEPDVWDVKAFRERSAAESLASEYTEKVREVEETVAAFSEEHEEPDWTDDDLTDAWYAWHKQLDAIRETHPDPHTHSQIERTHYSVVELELV